MSRRKWRHGPAIGDDPPGLVRVRIDVLVVVGDARKRLVIGEPLVFFAEPLRLGGRVAAPIVAGVASVEAAEPPGRPAEVEDAAEDPVFEPGEIERVRVSFGSLDVGSEAGPGRRRLDQARGSPLAP